MDRAEIDRILQDEPDVERAKARIEAILAAERLTLERERSERDEERLDREKRRWYANPLFVAVSVGALTLLGDFVASTYQSARDLTLQRERAASDLIRSAFVDDPEQTIRNLEFMIAADLIVDDGSIIAAAQQFGPRETVATETVTAARNGTFSPPVVMIGRIRRVLDGDTLSVAFDGAFPSEGPRPRANSDGEYALNLAGVDAAELRFPGCEGTRGEASRVWAQEARERAEQFVGGNSTPQRFRFVLTEVQFPGRLRGIVSPLTRAPDDPLSAFDASLNRVLLDAGLATMSLGDRLPEAVEDRVRALSEAAERMQRGMFAELTRQIDLDAETFGVVPPWLLRRACSVLRRDIEADAYFAQYFERTGFVDAATGTPLRDDAVVSVTGRKIEQKRPMHAVKFVARDPAGR